MIGLVEVSGMRIGFDLIEPEAIPFSARIRICATSSLRLSNEMVLGTSLIAPRFRGPTGKAQPMTNAGEFEGSYRFDSGTWREESLRALPVEATQELVIVG